MNHILSIDQGTTSTRAIIFNDSGAIVASAQKEHRQIYPKPGWVEHDPLEVLANTDTVIREAMGKANITSKVIAAVGITNQRETTVIWDKRTGKPFCNAIVWQDMRTDTICASLEKSVGGATIRTHTGLPIATYFSGPKIAWVLKNIPGVKEAAKKGDALFGTMDSWLIWNLTGGVNGGAHVTDVTNASRMMLMNLRTLAWDDELLRAMHVPRSMLPAIRPSVDKNFYGMTMADGPFGASIPIAGDLGDQQAALFGQACFVKGMSKNTYGTGCFFLMNTGTTPVFSKHGLITTAAYKIGNSPAVYALEGSVAVAGALVQWMRDNLGLIERSEDIQALARTVADNGDVYFVPAFSGLFAPYWKMNARGIIAGLTRFATKGHIARAVIEATAYQTRELYDAMVKDAKAKIPLLKVDGGMVRDELLMQFQADMLGVPVIRPKVTETTALGAAYAAGLAVGVWNDTDTLAKQWREDKRFISSMETKKRDALYRSWKKAVKRSFDWVE
ncbi:MAG: glycerol kinase GlpK [Spirochaetota bacterium]